MRTGGLDRDGPSPVSVPWVLMGAPDRVTRTTQLLLRMARGDSLASAELLPLLYDELHGIAQRFMAGERRDHTLQPTALLNEAWLRLAGSPDAQYVDRTHFLRVAARAMRHVLVDHARAKRSAKRGGGRAAVSLDIDEALAYWESDHTDLLALHEALERLNEKDPQLNDIVELRFFGGLTAEETGSALGLTERQVGLGWSFARGWLHRELQRGTHE